jgi:hypothetical protein
MFIWYNKLITNLVVCCPILYYSIYVPICEVIVYTRTKDLGSNDMLYVIYINDNYE